MLVVHFLSSILPTVETGDNIEPFDQSGSYRSHWYIINPELPLSHLWDPSHVNLDLQLRTAMWARWASLPPCALFHHRRVSMVTFLRCTMGSATRDDEDVSQDGCGCLAVFEVLVELPLQNNRALLARLTHTFSSAGNARRSTYFPRAKSHPGPLQREQVIVQIQCVGEDLINSSWSLVCAVR